MKKMSDRDDLSEKVHRKGSLFRKIFPVFLLLACMQVVMASKQQSAKLTVNFKEAPLEKVFDYLETNVNVVFTYNSEELKNDPSRITMDFKDVTLDEMLKICLEKSRFTYEKVGQHVVIRQRPQVSEHLLKGKVTNEKNEPMPGVTVRLEGTSLGVASDVEGNFTMRIPLTQGVLVFTFVGYKDKKVAFKDARPLFVKMEENVAALDEVQVVAYGEQKKRTMVSAVSSVKADDIKELPTHSLESLLQGHMAGVEVNNISGSPGGGGSVVAIRGYNSFFVSGEGEDRNYGTPLYVIDGVPIQAFTSPVTGANTLSDLDPSMIESVEVLKDAASAAIYGSRAGNGVILITTKKGRAGRARFTANASYSASWLPKTPVQTGGQAERLYHLSVLRNAANPYYDPATGEWKMTTSYDEVYKWPNEKGPYINYFWGRNGNRNAYILQDSLNPFYNNSTNWWKEVYRIAKVWNANIQAAGGSESIQYMVGAGYYNEEGIMLGSGFKRINILSNLSAQPAKRLRLDSRFSLTYSDRSRGGKTAGSNGLGGEKVEGITADPTKESSLKPGNGYVKERFLETLNSVQEKNQSYSARYNLVLDYEFIKNLHLSVSGSVDYNQQNQNHFEPSTMDTYSHFSLSQGTITRSVSLMNENLLNYNYSFGGRHNFKLLLGLSFMKDQDFSNSGSGKNGPSDYIHYVGEGWGNSGGLNYVDGQPTSAFSYRSSFSEERMCSYFGRLNYNYKEKYMFEMTLRRDGSSVFGEDVRWATFPSVAAGWAFSEEPFMKNLYWLSFGKVRLSYGTSGQKFRQRYLAHGLFSPISDTFEGQGAMLPNHDGGAINKNLTWEMTDQWDLGLDLNFFDYRLKLVADYYYRYTHAQLVSADLPGDIYYFDNQWQNGLATSNQGIELELQADILRETAVTWRLKVNGSRNWNRFEKSSDGYDFADNMVLKKPMYQIRTYKTEGFYNKQSEVPVYFLPDHTPQPLYSGLNNAIFFPGMRRIVDLNGDGKISGDDMYPAASPLPKFYGGIANEIRWKDFDLNIFFNYSLGRHILKVYEDGTLIGGPSSGAILADIGKINCWTGPDSKNPEYPVRQYFAYNGSQYNGYYDCDIEKVHMLRLKQLTLGYNLNKHVCQRIGVTGVRVFLTGENLFLLTNYSGLDPEIVNIYNGVDHLSSYPLPRKFTVGVTLNF